MPYSRRIDKIFKSAGDGDAQVQRKRSDGRMKTYDSATDLRAWTDLSEDRRQYILDLVKQGGGKGSYFGKYIPFEAIIDILVANKNATIKRLQQENNELKRNRKGQASSSSGAKFSSSSGAKFSSAISGVKLPSSRGADLPSSSGANLPSSSGAANLPSSRSAKLPSSRGADLPSSRGANLSSSSASSGANLPSSSGANLPSSRGAKLLSSSGANLPRKKSVTIMAPPKQKSQPKEPEASRQAGKRALTLTPKSASDTADGGKNVEDLFTTAPDGNRYSSTSSNADNDNYESDDSSPYYNSSKESEEKSPNLPVSRMTEKDLKDTLKEQGKIARLQYDDAVVAIEQLENIKKIVESEPRLDMTQPREVPKQIKPQATKESSSPVSIKYDDFESCTNEIDMLEKEIKAMENSSSHEQAVIQRELQVLKKMCEKLTQVQKENSDLRKDQEGLPATDDDALKEKLEKLKQVTLERDKWKGRVQKLEQEINNPQDEPDSKLNMREKYMDYRRRLDSVEGVDDEVKKLKEYASRMHQAGDSKSKEDLIAKNNELQQELDNLRNKLQEVEALQAKDDSLMKKNEEDQTGDNKDKEDLIAKNNELQRELDNQRLKLQEMETLQADNNSLKKNVEDLSKIEDDYNTLSSKTKNFDKLEAERDGYKSKCENLECECEKLRTKLQKASDLEDYYKHLSNKMENFDKLSAERDIYKRRCENLECECENLAINLRKADESEHERRLLLREIEDCESCMANQENEIKRLIGHVDYLTRELNEREQRSLPPAMVEAFSSFPHIPQAVILSPPYPKQRFTPTQTTLSQPQITQPQMEQRACSIKRIVELENTLLFKQKQTKQKVDSLQYNLEKFKRELELEKQKNCDLMSRYTNQSRTVTNMSIEIEIVRRESSQDKERLKHLNMVLKNILRNNTCQCPPERESSAAIDVMGPSTGPHPNEESS